MSRTSMSEILLAPCGICTTRPGISGLVIAPELGLLCFDTLTKQDCDHPRMADHILHVVWRGRVGETPEVRNLSHHPVQASR